MKRSLQLNIHREVWPLKRPFRIAGRCSVEQHFLVVEISDGRQLGRGEASGVHYLGETMDTLFGQIEGVAAAIEHGCDCTELQQLLPAGGARNALDCALWDLRAKREGTSVWQLTGITPKPVVTCYTLGIEDSAEEMAELAARAGDYSILKVKLDHRQPLERVQAVRRARPDATLLVDANQAWDFQLLTALAPRLAQLDVALIEQPLPRGEDAALEGYRSPVPLCADESCRYRGELATAARRYQVINIKLDKCGGLTEALSLAAAVKAAGLELMVGNMCGTSLCIAPAFVIAQQCRFVDLDGPLLLKYDRFPAMHYDGEKLLGGDDLLWGG